MSADRGPGSNRYGERSLSPEDFANIVEIVTWVNQIIQKQYPTAQPLNIDQVKIVHNLSEVEGAIAKEVLHSFFLQKVGDKVQFGGQDFTQSWTDPTSNTIFFDEEALDDMRKDKKVGYLGIGLDIVNSAVILGAKTAVLESEKATQTAIDILTGRYTTSLEGIVTENDLTEAISYLKEKGSQLHIRGLALAIMVEGKMFMPETGISSDQLIASYLARPVRVEYAQRAGNEFNLLPVQKASIENYAEDMMPLDVSIIPMNPRQMERDVLESLGRMGFRGRSSIMQAYQNGDIGKKIVELY